jgi:hypothetical protein
MKQQALGMIETRGLVPAVEAADAGVKAANVQLVGYEIVKGGLVMVAFVGEVAAVQASVSAGTAAAEKVGQVISTHVIPRPEADIRMVFQGKSAIPTDDHPPDPGPEGSGPGDDPVDPLPDSDDSGTAEPVQEESHPVKSETEKSSDTEDVSSAEVEEHQEDHQEDREEDQAEDAERLDGMTVGALRRLARSVSGLAMHGREISRANKGQLIQAIYQAKENQM